jgi:hypothetical protein
MCGIPWGVFQVRLNLSQENASQLIETLLLDTLDHLRLRGCTYHSQTVRHGVRMYVLGCGYPTLFWCRPSCGERQRGSRLATSLCNSMDLASSALHRRLLCPRISMECCQAGQDRFGAKELDATSPRNTGQGAGSGGYTRIYQAHHRDRKGRDSWCELLGVLPRN